jgi:hypothetical protein
MLLPNRSLPQRTPHATQSVQSRDPHVQPTHSDRCDTDTSVSRAASSDQTSSNVFDSNMSSGYADGAIFAAPDVGCWNVHGASAPVDPFHSNMEYHHMDVHNQACQSGIEPYQILHMGVGHSAIWESRENHRPWPTEAPLVDFPLPIYMNTANVDAPSQGPNCEESNTPYYSSVHPFNQAQRFHHPPFHGGLECYSQSGDPLALAQLSVHGGISAVVPQEPPTSMRPTRTLVHNPSTTRSRT